MQRIIERYTRYTLLVVHTKYWIQFKFLITSLRTDFKINSKLTKIFYCVYRSQEPHRISNIPRFGTGSGDYIKIL